MKVIPFKIPLPPWLDAACAVTDDELRKLFATILQPKIRVEPRGYFCMVSTPRYDVGAYVDTPPLMQRATRELVTFL